MNLSHLEALAVQSLSRLHGLTYAQVSPDLRIVYTSPSFQDILENFDTPLQGCLLTDALAEFVGAEELLQSVLQGGLASFQIAQVNRIQPDGSVAYLTFHILPLDDQQTGNGLLVIVEDTTEYGRLEHDLVQNRNELRLAQESLIRMNTELDHRVEQRTHELRRAKDQLQMQFERLNALRSIDLTILGTSDIYLALKAAVSEARNHLKVDTAVVMLFNPGLQYLESAAGYGVHASMSIKLRVGEGVMGKAALERRTMQFPDLDAFSPPFLAPLETMRKLKSIFAIPLIARGNLLGVFGAGFLSPFQPDQEWMNFFENLAGQATMAIDTIKSFENLQRSNAELFLAYESTIEGWSHAVNLRNQETFEHTERMIKATLRLARLAGITEEELIHVKRGVLLHDIGKLGIPDRILLKQEQLSGEEREMMRKHPVYAHDMLMPIAYLRPALDIPYCHHEKWDGSGYPRGLRGEQIPLAARVFSIVDVWDALRFDRPYRQRWPEEKIMEYLRSESGKYFDPGIVELFFQILADIDRDADGD